MYDVTSRGNARQDIVAYEVLQSLTLGINHPLVDYGEVLASESKLTRTTGLGLENVQAPPPKSNVDAPSSVEVRS